MLCLLPKTQTRNRPAPMVMNDVAGFHSIRESSHNNTRTTDDRSIDWHTRYKRERRYSPVVLSIYIHPYTLHNNNRKQQKQHHVGTYRPSSDTTTDKNRQHNCFVGSRHCSRIGTGVDRRIYGTLRVESCRCRPTLSLTDTNTHTYIYIYITVREATTTAFAAM